MSLNPTRYSMPFLKRGEEEANRMNPNRDHRMWQLRDQILGMKLIVGSIESEVGTFIEDPDILTEVDRAWDILVAAQKILYTRLEQIEILCYGSPQPAILENPDQYIHRQIPAELHFRRHSVGNGGTKKCPAL
jgi:hypothetical protein